MMSEKDRQIEKKKELATAAVWMKPSTKKRFKRIAGRDYPEFTQDEAFDAIMDTHEREGRMEEAGED